MPSLDRLSRSLADLIAIVATLRRHGVGFKSLHEALDTTTPGGRLVFHVFAALAEFIRELIVEGTREGLDAARPGPVVGDVGLYDRLRSHWRGHRCPMTVPLFEHKPTICPGGHELRPGRVQIGWSPLVRAY